MLQSFYIQRMSAMVRISDQAKQRLDAYCTATHRVRARVANIAVIEYLERVQCASSQPTQDEPPDTK